MGRNVDMACYIIYQEEHSCNIMALFVHLTVALYGFCKRFKDIVYGVSSDVLESVNVL